MDCDAKNGLLIFLLVLSGILSDKLGIRLTVLLGSLIASLGMLASSFLVDQVLVWPYHFRMTRNG